MSRASSIYCCLSFSLLIASTSWRQSLLSCALEGTDLYSFIFFLQRHSYWLNKDSHFEISCTLKDSESTTDSLIVAIVKGVVSFHYLFCNGDIWVSDSIVRCTLLSSSIALWTFLLCIMFHLYEFLSSLLPWRPAVRIGVVAYVSCHRVWSVLKLGLLTLTLI